MSERIATSLFVHHLPAKHAPGLGKQYVITIYSPQHGHDDSKKLLIVKDENPDYHR